MRKTLFRVVCVGGLAALATLACSERGVANPSSPNGPSPVDVAHTAQDVRIVEASELDAVREDFELSEPLGDVTGSAACESGSVTEACTEAARDRLRAAAVEHDANLVAVTGSAVAQSFPPRLTLRGTLYRATPR